MPKCIYINAGHGLAEDGKTPDNGAQGIVSERDMTLMLAKYLIAELNRQSKDFRIVTVSVDAPLSLIDAIAQINADMKANSYKDSTDLKTTFSDAIVVSIHCNSGGGTGIEGWFESDNSEGKNLASSLARSVAESTSLPLRKVDGDLNDRLGRLGIVRDTLPTSCLIECGFVDSQTDVDVLQQHPELFAVGICQGICQYFGMPFSHGVFPDVSLSDYGADAIRWCKEKGIVKGKTDGLFHPDDSISRRDLCIVLYRALHASNP